MFNVEHLCVRKAAVVYGVREIPSTQNLVKASVVLKVACWTHVKWPLYGSDDVLILAIWVWKSLQLIFLKIRITNLWQQADKTNAMEIYPILDYLSLSNKGRYKTLQVKVSFI